MPTVKVRDDLQFFFTDSGAPDAANYATLIIIHGHSFHSGTFQRLLPLAPSRSIRIIALNRREYPGTTPFTAEELRIFASGSTAERTKLTAQFGVDYAEAIKALSIQLSLPTEGGVAITAWSLGNTFLISLISAIYRLPDELKGTLNGLLRSFILWDPPTHALGSPNPNGSYIPFLDESMDPKERGPAFAAWVSSYWVHGDLSTHDPEVVDYRPLVPKHPPRKPTIETLSPEELGGMTDFRPGDKCDTILLTEAFSDVLIAQTHAALFTPETRASWPNVRFNLLYGSATSWNVVIGASYLQQEDKKLIKNAPHLSPLRTVLLGGANHFVMWDEPEKTIDVFVDCMRR